MKVTNHQKGNYTFVNNHDSSVMYGTIEMTRDEFAKVCIYLKRAKGRAWRACDTYVRDGLMHALDYSIPQMKEAHATRVCLGVTATRLIFEEYELPRYKKQNYVIQLID